MSEEVIGEDTAQAEQDEIQQDVEQEETATSDESQEGETEGDSEEHEAPRKTGAEKRIAQLTWKAREAERRAQELEQQLRQREASPPREAPKSDFPTLESVGYDEGEYQKAVAEYYAQQVDSTLTQREKARETEQRQRALQEKASDFYARGMAIAEDFDELVMQNASLPVTEAMRDALFATEKGPEILYHLANNPDEALRVANLEPYAMAVEIGRLEARMSMPQAKKASSAPPPVKPLSAGGEKITKNPDEMTTKQWLAWRQKQLKGS